MIDIWTQRKKYTIYLITYIVSKIFFVQKKKSFEDKLHKHNIGEREKLKQNVGYTDELAYAFCI